MLEKRSTKNMEDLESRDLVEVGKNQYSRIYASTHRKTEVVTRFVKVTLEDGKILELSHSHFVYDGFDKQVLHAKYAEIGHTLFNRKEISVQVPNIQEKRKRGLINPHTENANFIVNGVLTTTYTSAVSLHAAHSLPAPIRSIMCSIGVSATGLENISDIIPSYCTKTSK